MLQDQDIKQLKVNIILSTIPNSGVFRPKEARGRTDWLVFTNKAFQARGDLTADQKKFATGANIQVQGLRDEVQQLKKELQSLKEPWTTRSLWISSISIWTNTPLSTTDISSTTTRSISLLPSTTISIWVSSATSTVLSSSKTTNSIILV